METLIWFHPRVEQKDKLIVKENIQVLPTKFQDISEFNLDKNKKYKLALVYHQTNNQNIPFYKEHTKEYIREIIKDPSKSNMGISDDIINKYKKFSKELISLVENYNIEILDLLTCDSEPFEKIEGLEIRYSLDKTGNDNGDSTNWILESHDINVKDEYFTSTEGFTDVLGTMDFLTNTGYFSYTTVPIMTINGSSYTNVKKYTQIKDFIITQNDIGQFPITLPTGNIIIEGNGVNYLGKQGFEIHLSGVNQWEGFFKTTANNISNYFIRNLNVKITSSIINNGGGWIGAREFGSGNLTGYTVEPTISGTSNKSYIQNCHIYSSDDQGASTLGINNISTEIPGVVVGRYPAKNGGTLKIIGCFIDFRNHPTCSITGNLFGYAYRHTNDSSTMYYQYVERTSYDGPGRTGFVYGSSKSYLSSNASSSYTGYASIYRTSTGNDSSSFMTQILHLGIEIRSCICYYKKPAISIQITNGGIRQAGGVEGGSSYAVGENKCIGCLVPFIPQDYFISALLGKAIYSQISLFNNIIVVEEAEQYPGRQIFLFDRGLSDFIFKVGTTGDTFQHRVNYKIPSGSFFRYIINKIPQNINKNNIAVGNYNGWSFSSTAQNNQNYKYDDTEQLRNHSNNSNYIFSGVDSSFNVPLLHKFAKIEYIISEQSVQFNTSIKSQTTLNEKRFVKYSTKNEIFSNFLNLVYLASKETPNGTGINLKSTVITDIVSFKKFNEDGVTEQVIPENTGLTFIEFENDPNKHHYYNSTTQIYIDDQTSKDIASYEKLDMVLGSLQSFGSDARNYFKNIPSDSNVNSIIDDVGLNSNAFLSKMPLLNTTVKQHFIEWCYKSENMTPGESEPKWIDISSSSSEDFYIMPWGEWDVTGPAASKNLFTGDVGNREVDITNVSKEQFSAILYELSFLNNRFKFGTSGSLNSRSDYKSGFFSNTGDDESAGYSNNNFENIPEVWLNEPELQDMKKIIIMVFLMIKHKKEYHKSNVNFGVF